MVHDGRMLAAFSVAPMGAAPEGDDGASVVDPVARCVRIVRESGLPNETTAMFTTIEGEWEPVFDVIRECVESVLEGAPRASVVIKLDCRPGHTDMLTSKVARVEARLEE